MLIRYVLFIFVTTTFGGCDRGTNFDAKTDVSKNDSPQGGVGEEGQIPGTTLEGDPTPTPTPGVKPPEKKIPFCASDDKIIEAGGTVNLNFNDANSGDTYVAVNESGQSVAGSVVASTSVLGQVEYRAPASISSNFVALIGPRELTSDLSKYCQVGVIVPGYLGIEGGIATRLRLPVAKVYQLAQNTNMLPNFSNMSSIQNFKFANININQRAFTIGFPGVNNLIEWFGVRYDFKLKIPSAGRYSFKISSDDGSKFYIHPTPSTSSDISNSLLLNLDGLATSSRAKFREGNIDLVSGSFLARVDFFQGPGNSMGLVLLWKKPGDADFEVVPESVFAPAP